MLVHRVLRVVHVGDEVLDPALGIELVPLLALALVDEHDPQPLGQERGLAEALDEDLLGPHELVEDLKVGQERDRRPGLLRRAHLLEVGRGLAAGELLVEELATALDLDVEPRREGVDHRDADAVQAAGDLVAVAAEFAAGVELRQHHRHCGEPLVLHHVGGNARAVVGDRDRVVRMQDDFDEVGAARHGLVDGVVDHLEDEVMEAARARRADVHARSQPDWLEAFEDSNVFCAVRSFSH